MTAQRATAAPAILLLAVLGVLACLRRLLTVVTVEGVSMLPTYPPGRRLLVLRRPLARPRTGSTVVFRLPASAGTGTGVRQPPLLIKRVAAMSGQPVPEAVRQAVGAAEGDLVPAGALVLLADAGGSSGDSRTWGYVRPSAVTGMVIRILR